MKRLAWLWLLVALWLMVGIVPIHAQDSADTDVIERTLQHDGRTRRYLLYLPPTYDGTQAVPLVFVLHGGGGTPEGMMEHNGFTDVARDEDFILVYPAGTGRFDRLLTWNGAHCCGYAWENGVDDVGFFRAMVDELTAEFTIDPARIYVTGHSNGAIMSYRLAAEMSDVFAAVGVVAGGIGGYPTTDSPSSILPPEPEYPVSILHIHGMEDTVFRYDGGLSGQAGLFAGQPIRIDVSVNESIGFWLAVDQCTPTPDHDERDNGMVWIDTYDCPDTGTGVELITIVDGQHSWPGGTRASIFSDPPSTRVDATAEIWAFFAEHPKPGSG